MRAPSVACLLGLLAAVGCGRPPGHRAPDSSREAVGEASFESLYARSCAGCHGAEGRLGPARPLRDPLYLALVDDAAIARIIDEGVPGSLHPAFGRSAGGDLDDAQIQILVSGMRKSWGSSRETGAGSPPWSGAEATREFGPGDPARGEEVFRMRCASCHGPRGMGGAEAGPVVDPDYLGLVSDQALRSAVIFGRSDLGMPSWRGAVGGGLAPREVSDVVAWLAAHRPARAALVPTTPTKGDRR